MYKSVGGLTIREVDSFMNMITFNIYNFMDLEFEDAYEEIAFEDILKVKENCKYKVKHELLYDVAEIYTKDYLVEGVVSELKSKKWMNFCDIMLAISYNYSSDKIKDIITNGTWYIKRD